MSFFFVFFYRNAEKIFLKNILKIQELQIFDFSAAIPNSAASPSVIFFVQFWFNLNLKPGTS